MTTKNIQTRITLTPKALSLLEDIKAHAGHRSLSEAIMYCISLANNIIIINKTHDKTKTN